VTGTPSSGDSRTRTWLAVGIVVLSVVGIAVISVVVIDTATASGKPEMSRLVFSAVLPLLGTWVGTVLAFYFAKENLQAATDSTLKIIASSTGDQATPVTTVMIAAADIVAYDLGAGDRPEDIKLADVSAKMANASPPRHRLPIRNASGAVLYVIHDSTLTEYAQSVGETVATLTKTLGDLLAVPKYKVPVEAVAFVPQDATLAQARAAMTSVKFCNDVFVTAHGKRDEPALGWLTNTLLAGVE
jgi:hypothetical protein